MNNSKEIVLQKYPEAEACIDDGYSYLIVAPGIILSDSYLEKDDAWNDAAWRFCEE